MEAMENVSSAQLLKETDPEEYDLVVLGGGTGSTIAAWTLANQGQRVAVIERKYVGGSCPNIEIYGNSIPARTVGGDLFEYINFQQRYDIDARIQRALKRSKDFLEPLQPGALPRNSVDDHVEWLKSRPGYRSGMETEYRDARSSEQMRVARRPAPAL